jgi:glucosamine--fructose-6-phosphate aminotransferase (isomerizing)
MAQPDRQKMTRPPLVENILGQGISLPAAAAYHFGAGMEPLRRAAQLLRAANHVVIAGMGASQFASIALSSSLAQRGIPASVIEASELLYYGFSALSYGTCAIAVSRSGESVEIVKLLPVLRAQGASIIAVTNDPASSLARAADAVLLLNCPPDQMVAIQSFTVTALVLGLLGAACFGDLDRARADLNPAFEQLPAWIQSTLDASETWAGFLDPATPLYFLGRGPSLASVREAVLLMHETAKMPAVGMSSAEFRHGPVEALGPQFRAVVFGSPCPTAALDLSLARDLVRLGAQVRWIGPLASDARDLELCPWNAQFPAGFANVFEIIPAQIAAYRMAELRGLTIGEFRFAPQVTTTESGFLNQP